jgi:hypothetical protein
MVKNGAAKVQQLDFFVSSRELQEKWIQALINSGLTFQEDQSDLVSSASSIFEFKALDIDLKERSLEEFKPKVLSIPSLLDIRLCHAASNRFGLIWGCPHSVSSSVWWSTWRPSEDSQNSTTPNCKLYMLHMLPEGFVFLPSLAISLGCKNQSQMKTSK